MPWNEDGPDPLADIADIGRRMIAQGGPPVALSITQETYERLTNGGITNKELYDPAEDIHFDSVQVDGVEVNKRRKRGLVEPT